MDISKKHPAVRIAEAIYMQALSKEGATPAKKAFGLMEATSKLEEAIFADCLF